MPRRGRCVRRASLWAPQQGQNDAQALEKLLSRSLAFHDLRVMCPKSFLPFWENSLYITFRFIYGFHVEVASIIAKEHMAETRNVCLGVTGH